MNRSYLLISTEKGRELEVGSDLRKFEGVVQDVELLEEEGDSRVLAEVITDDMERLNAFIEEQVDPIPGITNIRKMNAS